jgi:hypothetical protein
MRPLFQLPGCIFDIAIGEDWQVPRQRDYARARHAVTRAHDKRLRHLPRFCAISNSDQKPPQYGGIP